MINTATQFEKPETNSALELIGNGDKSMAAKQVNQHCYTYPSQNLSNLWFINWFY